MILPPWEWRDAGVLGKNAVVSTLPARMVEPMDKKRRLYLRLSRVSVEVSILNEHLELIEEQIKRGEKEAKCKLDTEIRGLTPDDEDSWSRPHDEYDYQVEVTLPRILRNPFLVSLFAVYESAVTTIAELVQEEKGQKIAIDDLRGRGFLNRSKRYYRHILQFDLSTDNERWKRLMVLSDLRNAIAHSNGRYEAISKELRRRIKQQGFLDKDTGFIIVPGIFLRETVAVVKGELEDLLARYEKWETAKNPR